MQQDPTWITEARKYIGQKEIKGAKTNSFIAIWLKQLKAWWGDDETPWCGTFVAHCMQSQQYQLPPNWMRAKDWLNFGQKIMKPAYGCVVVFEREGGGHVGFVVGQDSNKNLMVLGGNQGDSVKISPFDRNRVIGYRWPQNTDIPSNSYDLPIILGDNKLSTNEA